MNVRLALIAESGEVLDSTDLLTADEWNRARTGGPGAFALLYELRYIDIKED